jgi:hypothetical protein
MENEVKIEASFRLRFDIVAITTAKHHIWRVKSSIMYTRKANF